MLPFSLPVPVPGPSSDMVTASPSQRITQACRLMEDVTALLSSVWDEVKETTNEDLPSLIDRAEELSLHLSEIETWGLFPSYEKANGGYADPLAFLFEYDDEA